MYNVQYNFPYLGGMKPKGGRTLDLPVTENIILWQYGTDKSLTTITFLLGNDRQVSIKLLPS